MPRDPLRVHRLIDPQHIGPAGGSFLQSRLGGVVDGLAQQRQRLRLPQAAGALRQQTGLVIAPLAQAPDALLVDTSDMTIDQVVRFITDNIQQKLSSR